MCYRVTFESEEIIFDKSWKKSHSILFFTSIPETFGTLDISYLRETGYLDRNNNELDFG